MTNTDNVLPIPLEEIKENRKIVNGILSNVKFTPTIIKEKMAGADPVILDQWMKYTQSTGGNTGDKASVIQALSRFSDGPELLSTNASFVGNAVKYGYALGITLAGMYSKASGLSNMRKQNATGNLPPAQVVEFQQKQQTEAAVELFGSAYYIVWELSQYHTEEVSGRVIPKITLPEFNILDARQAYQFSLFYYTKFMEPEKIVSDDVALVKFTIEYFTAILNELNLFKTSLKYTDEFESRSYKLDGTEFIVRGFSAELSARVQNVEFRRVKFEEVTGNRDSKHGSERMIQTLMCYDPKEGRNVMKELGGLQDVTLGEGPPGTGKSMIIAAIATDLYDRCKDLGIEFLYWPFPPNPVSEYQGGSSTRVLDWFKPLKDKRKIIYGPIDDAENNLVSRGSKSISSGNREVISIFLTETEGAGAVKYGNYAIQLFTNRPEDLDSAVLSRIQGRMKIEGSITWEDFMDQDKLWWSQYDTYMEGFVDLQASKEYEYFENQKRLISLSKLYEIEGDVIPKNETFRKIFLDVSNRFNPKKEHQFYGVLWQEVKKAFPFVTSRDMRNVQTGISTRIMDFPFRDEWMKDNANFFAKKCDEKKQMLIELMKENMKGMSFADVRLQEVVRYLDITIAINETKFETAVKEKLEEMQVFDEAKKRLIK